MTKVIVFANFKGGVGKTTNTCMTAYTLAKRGYKVLVIDKDPQANVTSFFINTLEQMGKDTPDMKFLLEGIEEGSLINCVTPITDNLSMIPTTPRFQYYPFLLERMFKGASEQKDFERVAYFSTLLDEIKHDYDYVFIDIPPTFSKFTDTALYATDYVVVVLQTQHRALQGAEILVEYLNDIIVGKYGHDLDVPGVLPVIMKSDSKIDQATLINAENSFGAENLFNTHIKQMERLKRYDITGITDLDYHDKKVFEVYEELADELLERIGKLGGVEV